MASESDHNVKTDEESKVVVRTLVDKIHRMDELDRLILKELKKTAETDDGFKRFFAIVEGRPDLALFEQGVEELANDPKFFFSTEKFVRKHAVVLKEHRALSMDIRQHAEGPGAERGDVTHERVLNALIVREFAIVYGRTLKYFAIHYDKLWVQT